MKFNILERRGWVIYGKLIFTLKTMLIEMYDGNWIKNQCDGTLTFYKKLFERRFGIFYDKYIFSIT